MVSQIKSVLKSATKFRKTNVSVLILLTYIMVAILYISKHTRYQSSLPDPTLQPELDNLLENAWLDLQNITFSFHPYASYDNDRVHDFLKLRINEIIGNKTYMEVSDDYDSNLNILFKQQDTFNASSITSRIIYFESSNLLVKVQGSNSSLPGLLVSAHFDAVPTSHGATDDGIGIVTMLALLQNIADSKHQPQRTIIFNFNNNEEFGLLGASAFFKHEWSKLVSYSLNLEGAGAGGKAVLLRTSDISTANMYKDSVKLEPFGNSIYQEAFYKRYIRSETDFKVYEEHGLRGWDIAFYRPRDLYHTVRDSLQYTSKASVWHMLNTALQLTTYLATTDDCDTFNYSSATYFDLAGLKLIIINTRSLFFINILLLLLGPALTFTLHAKCTSAKIWKMRCSKIWLRLPFAFVVSSSVTLLFIVIIFKKNTFIFSSDYLTPLLLSSSCFILINHLLISLFDRVRPSQDFKLIIFRELAIVSWVCLFATTVRLYKSKYRNTGSYPISILYFILSLSTNIGYGSLLLSRYNDNKQSIFDDTNNPDVTPTLDLTNNAINGTAPQYIIHSDSDASSNETSLLINAEPRHQIIGENGNELLGNSYIWIVQFLITVPILSFFFFNIFDLILEGLNQTVQDNGNAIYKVFALIFIGGIITGLPMLPFAYKFSKAIVGFLVVTMVFTFISSLNQEAFNNVFPLKVRFLQTINLFTSSLENSTSIGAEVSIFSLAGGFALPMLKDMPSVKQQNITPVCNIQDNKIEICTYDGLLPNLISYVTKKNHEYPDLHDLMRIEILKNTRLTEGRAQHDPIQAELKIHVLDNRVCNLYFTSNNTKGQSALKQVTIFNNGDNPNPTLTQKSGIDELQLHKLDFQQPYYHVGLEWFPRALDDIQNVAIFNALNYENDDKLYVNISCFWAEYDTPTVIDREVRRKVPALDELLKYSPLNFTFTNREKGLVVLKDYIEL